MAELADTEQTWDLDGERGQGRPPRSAQRALDADLPLMLGAPGVLYGDIGTSPLYSLQTVFLRHGDGLRRPPKTARQEGVKSRLNWPRAGTGEASRHMLGRGQQNGAAQ